MNAKLGRREKAAEMAAPDAKLACVLRHRRCFAGRKADQLRLGRIALILQDRECSNACCMIALPHLCTTAASRDGSALQSTKSERHASIRYRSASK